jgi:hypothetical protein
MQGIGSWGGDGCRLARRWDGGLVLMLCLCVFLQMLGVPAPLLDAGGSFDIGGSSVQEGWSIHAPAPLLPTSSEFVRIAAPQPSLCAFMLARMLFHPPLSC